MNLIPRNSPFGALDSFFDDNFPTFRLLPEAKMDVGKLAVDITENDKNYTVKADFPGVNKDDIEVSVDNNVLTISAEHKDEAEEKKEGTVIRQERRFGKYSRSFNLGKNIDEASIKAEFENGVLTLMIPKGEVPPARKQIPIK